MKTSENFFESTKADYQRVDSLPNGFDQENPDYESRSGSKYWYTDQGVYRMSDHWGYGIASCWWFLDGGFYGYGMHPVDFEKSDYRHGIVVMADGTDRYQGDREMAPVIGFCEWAKFTDK